MAVTVQVDVAGGGPFFNPEIVTVAPGDTVEWIWRGDVGHSVTSGDNGTSDGLFDSGIQTAPFTFSFTFPTAGTVHYFCRPHYSMGMTGEVRVVPSTSVPGSLGNISTRLRVQSGDNALIGGMIATGSVAKRVIVRAIGPSLTAFGVPGALANPTLELFQGNTLLFSNDDWQSSQQQAEISASGLAPSHSAEAAIIWTLAPGQNYTSVVRGQGGSAGIGVVEAYDLDQAAASKLGNISTRGFVEVDDNVMIAGLIAGPSNGTSLKVLVRALGPTLGDFGVPGALANPTLELVNSSGTVIRSNNNWKDSQHMEIEAAQLAPNHDNEAALVETVGPGAYTAIVRGNDRTAGVALVEVYHIP